MKRRRWLIIKSTSKNRISFLGKLKLIQRNATDSNPTINIKYTYDAAGNRISKQATSSSNITYTRYVRDAQGNVMSTYKSVGSGSTLTSYSVDLSEQHLYGSSRIGILNRTINMKVAFTQEDILTFERGHRQYELSNHLGNVLVTITDKKEGVSTNGTTIDNFIAEVSSANDYYPFGMGMPDRKFSTDKCRYGFNGKENDKEFGEGMQDYGMRINDNRLGRFLSVDPLTKKYPHYTPYQFAGNKPVNHIDLDGLEEYKSYGAYKKHKGGAALAAMDGSDGAWLTSDRKERNPVWAKAMETITMNRLEDRFTVYTLVPGKNACETCKAWSPIVGGHIKESYDFAVVRDYYNWAQHEVDSRGMNSEWAKGASYLVNGLAENESGLMLSGTYSLLKQLNLAIAVYAVKRFNQKFYGTDLDGYDFDFSFITDEQGIVANPVYSKTENMGMMKTVNSLSRKEGALHWIAGGLMPYIPDFKSFNTDITNADKNFGQWGRTNIPLLMLYTDKHAEQLMKTEGYKVTGSQMTQAALANEFIRVYYETKMKY